MNERTIEGPRRRRVRSSAGALALLLVALVTTACPTEPGGGPSNQQAFCELWEAVAVEAPTEDSAVLVKPGVVALAGTTATTGDSCTDASSKIAFGDAVLAEGEVIPSNKDDFGSDPVAAVAGDEVSPRAPVLENVAIRSLDVTVDSSGIGVRGTVGLRISGAESQIGFIGSLRDIQNWSVSLSSDALTIPGITTGPATFSGTLTSTNGAISLVLKATVPSARIGDVRVTGTTITVRASTADGVEIAVAGSVAVGPAAASGTLHIAFDRAGGLVIAEADLDLALSGIQADGSRINLAGKLDIDGNADETVATFSATGNIGHLEVGLASGTITMTPNQAVFDGFVDIRQGPNFVRFDGSIVWDGQVAFTPFLVVEAGGEFSGTLENGQNVSIVGITETTIVNGQLVTIIRGDFEFGTLKATGEAVVNATDHTTEFTVDASLVAAGFDADISGTVVMANGAAELVDLEATMRGSATIGDLELTVGSLEIRSTAGRPLTISFDGGVRIGDTATLFGDAEVVFGPDGTIMSLVGNVGGSAQIDGWSFQNLLGSIHATPEQVTVTAEGEIRMTSFPLGIDVDVTFTSSFTELDWVLEGNGRVIVGPFDVADGRILFRNGENLHVVRIGAYVRLTIFNIWVEGDLHLKPSGGCDHLRLTNGGLVAKAIIRNHLPGPLGCPVRG